MAEIIQWHDDEGWTQEILLWIMAWIEVCEEQSLVEITDKITNPPLLVHDPIGSVLSREGSSGK